MFAFPFEVMQIAEERIEKPKSLLLLREEMEWCRTIQDAGRNGKMDPGPRAGTGSDSEWRNGEWNGMEWKNGMGRIGECGKNLSLRTDWVPITRRRLFEQGTRRQRRKTKLVARTLQIVAIARASRKPGLVEGDGGTLFPRLSKQINATHLLALDF
jgi:hypothetical protein